MSSTTVAQQPLNFGPEWLRALSTPETTTPIPSSSGSGSGNIFKFAATKYRYSKDEILALRSNVTERLAEDIRNEIMENLKDVESVFRPNIIEPLTLSTPSAEENAKMNSLSSYISGRTPGGGRGGNNSQQSQQQQDSRMNRGGGSASNGRGGGSRGRGRDNTFGSNRGNNNSEDNGENGGNTGGGDDTSVPSSSWSRGGFPPRGGGGSFSNRVRSYDDRESSQSFRRGGGPRQTADGWRRSRGDDEENNDQNEESSTPPSGSTSWTSRGGQARRGGGGGGSMEYRTKSNDKWNYNDDRPEKGQSNSYESNQSRGWRSNAAMSDRDLNARRPQGKRDRMPEWMDDNNDDDNQLSNATFEKGTFTDLSSNRQNNNSNEKLQSQISTDDVSTRGNISSSKQQDNNKTEKPISSQTDSAIVNISTAAETITKPAPEPTPPIQHTTSSWEDEFEPSDVATTVVESTLAEDHDYSPPISSHTTPHPISMESINSQQRTQPSVIIDDKQWFYRDPQNTVQGPFSSADMERWFAAGYFTILLPVKRLGETQFSTIQQLTKELGRLPFRTDVPSNPSSVQQPVVSEPQKFNPMTYITSSSSSAANNAYLEEYLMQQQQQSRQNIQHSMLFNRQTSVPASTTDRKPVTSPASINPQLQAYFASQQQQQPHSQSTSSLFSSNLVTDPAIVYQQQQPQLQRSVSTTNQQPLFDEIQRSFHQIPSQTNSSSFFGTNVSNTQSQRPDDIMTRLVQAMQNHGQQQEKVEEQRRLEQRRELELERIKLAQQAEQLRLQREEEERRQLEQQQQQQQQQQRLEEELRKKKEATANKQIMFDQMKEMAKTMDQKKQQQQQQAKPQPKPEIDPFLAFQQSLQFQKEQQAKIEAQKAENVRRFQQKQQQQTQPTLQPQQQQQQQQTFKLPETVNWARHSSQTNDQNQPLNFAEIQKQEQEQERRAREAAMTAQQLNKTEGSNTSNSSSSSNNKSGSWARTLFAGSNSGNTSVTSTHPSSDHDINENPLPESPITSYNQQATNAVLSLLNINPKSRSATNQQSAPWSATNNPTPNTSLQDIQRQQSQSESKPQQPPQPQQQTHQTSSGHSTPAWGGVFQQSTSSPQGSSLFWGDNQPSSSTTKPASTSGNKQPSAPWTELKSSAPSTTKSNPTNYELTKCEREAQCLFTTARTQDALSKWTQTQFKDNLQAIDVPTLVQLLKDIDTAEEIVEYVQPYIGSVIKAKEFAKDFIVKRKQLSNAESELDNDRLNELAMAPTSSNPNSGNNGDEGFQVASSNGQKKKAKKMKGQKIDVKQLGFMVNNRPEQRDDIDKVPM